MKHICGTRVAGIKVRTRKADKVTRTKCQESSAGDTSGLTWQPGQFLFTYFEGLQKL
jgi:hypothetical protein